MTRNEVPIDGEARREPVAMHQRLQKIIAQAGLASRREAEEMILAGRVSVNDQIVRTLGTQANSERDQKSFTSC